MNNQIAVEVPTARLFDAEDKLKYIMLQMDLLYNRLEWCIEAGAPFQGEADMISDMVRYLDEKKQYFKKFLQNQ